MSNRLSPHTLLACVLMMGFAACGMAAAASELFVAATGDDTAVGSKAAPFATLERARDAIRALKQRDGLPTGGVTVWLRGGRYRLKNTFTLSGQDSGTAERPVTYRSFPGERAVLDGGVLIGGRRFARVSDEGVLGRLHPAARGAVVVADVKALGMEALFRGRRQISFNGRMMRLARWPNRGFSHIGKVHDRGAVYAHGRTKGERPKYGMANPIGGEFTPMEKFSPLAEAELARSGDVELEGFLAYDWYKTRHRVARIAGARLKLLDYHRYGVGVGGEKIPRRIRLLNILCELDEPGQWYYDPVDGALYLWPPGPLRKTDAVSVWHVGTAVGLSGVSHVTLRNVDIESFQGQGVVMKGGTRNLIAGCRIRNCGRGVVVSGGTHNGITGCDIFDVGGHHVLLEGGDVKTLTAAHNFVTNTHMTQFAHDGERGVRVRGVGNLFAHNLIHDFVGQGIVYNGNDNIFEYNEIYNVGIEEGDGGATYCGAQLHSYGNVLRWNFVHHLICVPQAHPRGGIYLDDLDAGDTVFGNVFYKAAHRAVLVNNGPANVVANNIFINGYIGIYNTAVYAEKARKMAKEYEAGRLKRGDKMDYLWRCEQVVGKRGWNSPPWSTRYPLFKKVMSLDFYYPVENKFTDNYFHGNAKQDVWLNKVPDGMIEISGHRRIAARAFANPRALDFRLKPNVKLTRGFRPIPFEKIGLYIDEYRTSMPDKDRYRADIRKRFESMPSYDPDARYDPKTINERLYPGRRK